MLAKPVSALNQSATNLVCRIFCLIKKHGQVNVIGGANEKPDYPRVKRMARVQTMDSMDYG